MLCQFDLTTCWTKEVGMRGLNFTLQSSIHNFNTKAHKTSHIIQIVGLLNYFNVSLVQLVKLEQYRIMYWAALPFNCRIHNT